MGWSAPGFFSKGAVVENDRIGLAGARIADHGARVHRTLVAEERVSAHRPVPIFEWVVDENLFQWQRRI